MSVRISQRQAHRRITALQAAAHPRRLAAALAAVTSALLAWMTFIPSASAVNVVPGDSGTPAVLVVTEGGMPGWQITLIAVGAALVAAVAAVAADRARAARRAVATSAS